MRNLILREPLTWTCAVQVQDPAFAERRSLKRSVSVSQVLGTDMKKHFDILSRFQACVASCNNATSVMLAQFDMLSASQLKAPEIASTTYVWSAHCKDYIPFDMHFQGSVVCCNTTCTCRLLSSIL